MAWKTQYSERDIETLIRMWEEGRTAAEIGVWLSKSTQSVRQFIHRNREKYDLEKKERGRRMSRSSFDKQWHGVVPCGHWMITKPWSKAS